MRIKRRKYRTLAFAYKTAGLLWGLVHVCAVVGFLTDWTQPPQDIIRVEKDRDAAWERFSEVSKQLNAAEASLKNKTLALTSLLNDLEALGVEPKKHNTEEEQK